MKASLFHAYLSSGLFYDWLTAKLLLALAGTVILGSESHGTHDHTTLSVLYAVQRQDDR
jgi:hypothetical protein